MIEDPLVYQGIQAKVKMIMGTESNALARSTVVEYNKLNFKTSCPIVDCWNQKSNSKAFMVEAMLGITDDLFILKRPSVDITKAINSDHFLWMVNHFSKRAMHENEQDL